MFFWEEKVFEYVNKNSDTFNKLKMYVSLIIENNKKFNLTGWDEELIWKEGIYQSIVLLDKSIKINEPYKLLDIGAGAGFPSIPFYIFKQNKINLDIYEPIKKRVLFLEEIKEKLNLFNLNIFCKRIEEEPKKEIYDVVTARAVMPLNMLIEVSSKIGKINCQYVFLKSKEANNELEESKMIIDKLNIKNIEINEINLNDNKTHKIISYFKENKTPNNFPRKWSEIKKQNKI